MTVYLFTKMKEKMQEYFYPKEETYSKSETYSQTQADNKFASYNHTHDKYSHPTSGVQANTTPSLKKIAYDDMGHITDVDDININELTITDADVNLDNYCTKEYIENNFITKQDINNELNFYKNILKINCDFNDIIILDVGPQGYNIPDIDKGKIIAKYYDEDEYVYVKEDNTLYYVENHDDYGNGESKILNPFSNENNFNKLNKVAHIVMDPYLTQDISNDGKTISGYLKSYLGFVLPHRTLYVTIINTHGGEDSQVKNKAITTNNEGKYEYTYNDPDQHPQTFNNVHYYEIRFDGDIVYNPTIITKQED